MTRTPSEKSIVNKITRYLDRIGAYWINVHGGEFGRRGVPDLIVCFRGLFVALEVKKPVGGVVSLPQKIEIARINERGGHATVVTSLEEAVNALQTAYTQWGTVDD